MKIAAVRRDAVFSPNSEHKDAAIFDAVVAELRLLGFQVTEYSEKDVAYGLLHEDAVLNMGRSPYTLQSLKAMEDRGATVVNSAYGIENCAREAMTRALLLAGVPSPRSYMIDTAAPIAQMMQADGMASAWIKRADFQAVAKEDVCFAPSPEAAASIVEQFRQRGVERVVVNEHLVGDLIKFYGVAGTDFFYWFYPSDTGHSKYGHEEINGRPQKLYFHLDGFKNTCTRAAQALRVDIYGGDAVVAPDGTVRIIDFNDWPSFAPCRAQAAHHIAACVANKICCNDKND